MTRFLEMNEIQEWCHEHVASFSPQEGFQVGGEWALKERFAFERKGRVHLNEGLLTRIFELFGEWEECLFVVTEWGIWSSSEDWPAYYAERGEAGERRSIETAPGHLFARDEGGTLMRFLKLVLLNGWDVEMSLVAGNGSIEVRANASHDGWLELFHPAKALS